MNKECIIVKDEGKVSYSRQISVPRQSLCTAVHEMTVNDAVALHKLFMVDKRCVTNSACNNNNNNHHHLFVPIAIETSGCFSKTGLELITELGNRLKLVTGDKLELTYLFQRLYISIQYCLGNELCFNGTFVPH